MKQPSLSHAVLHSGQTETIHGAHCAVYAEVLSYELLQVEVKKISC